MAGNWSRRGGCFDKGGRGWVRRGGNSSQIWGRVKRLLCFVEKEKEDSRGERKGILTRVIGEGFRMSEFDIKDCKSRKTYDEGEMVRP